MSDRLYVTSPAMMEEMREQFISWLEDVNRILRVKNVAVHPEVRLNETGIHVIEFNPMRFMGMGVLIFLGTPMAYVVLRCFLRINTLIGNRSMQKTKSTRLPR